ncbi:MAG TPA: hypothetical protein VK499_04675, partial [Propionibacteriaceae bacterium]|nr:hypothetical protein [Propionibacteriaceae bacterium]
MNNDGGNRAIDLCLRARHADLDQPVRLWYGAGTLAQPVRVEAQSVRVIIPPLRGRTSGGIEHAPVASRVVEIDFAPPAGDFAGVNELDRHSTSRNLRACL